MRLSCVLGRRVGSYDCLGVVFGLEREEALVEQLMVHRLEKKKALVEHLCCTSWRMMKMGFRWS